LWLQAVIKRVVPYIEMEEFSPTAVAKVSKACKSICQWVRAMYVYHSVALQVEPKRAALAAAQAELDDTNRALAAAQASLRVVQARAPCLVLTRLLACYRHPRSALEPGVRQGFAIAVPL
jgi:dynein heavy chain, axonemal